jgi:uncharacterized protein (DUF305 family)
MVNQRISVISLVLAGVLVGFTIGREVSPDAAVARSFAPTPSTTMQSMMGGTPMPGGMMHGGMTGCPAYQDMMDHAKSTADRALMRSMMSMHESMESMRLTGDADHDFLVMMIPHHQMAVAMAKVELQNGKDPRTIALAKSIISAQQKEIDDMQAWLH